VVLYECETWSLTLREEHRLRVFENRVLRRIFGPKRDEVTGGWRKLHNEELHNLIKSRKMRWTGHVARMEKRNICIGYWWERQKERDHWEDEDVAGETIILRWILDRMRWCGLDQYDSG
jgi:hypothetical protein